MSDIRERLQWPVTPELYEKIRRLWIKHSIAEDKRDLDGLLETLSEDCVYEVMPTGQRWQGHAGARTFYLTFLGAFPDVKFHLQDIVIGPQGVMEVAEMVGTHQGEWAGMPPTGREVRLTVTIHFPWDPAAQKFAGEKVYFDRAAMGYRDLIQEQARLCATDGGGNPAVLDGLASQERALAPHLPGSGPGRLRARASAYHAGGTQPSTSEVLISLAVAPPHLGCVPARLRA